VRAFSIPAAAALSDYELLELVLFAAIPRRDVKPLAKTLLAKFGSFAEVVAASRERLSEHLGDGAIAQLKIIEAAALRLSRTMLMGKPAAQLLERASRLLRRRDGAPRPRRSSASSSSTARIFSSATK